MLLSTLRFAGRPLARSPGFGPIVQFIWLPMLVFEVTLALWLLIKGVRTPNT